METSDQDPTRSPFSSPSACFSRPLPANWLLMWKPLDGKPRVNGSDYWSALWRWHFAGILGGMIWCAGAVTNFLGSGAHKVGPAVSYSIGQGATMVSACWGVFVWHEFAGASTGGKEIARIHVCVLSPGPGIHCRCPALLTTRDRPSKTAPALLRPPKAFQIGPS